MGDSSQYAGLRNWRPVTSDPSVMRVWQVLFKDHRGDDQEYFSQPYYYVATEKMNSEWQVEANIEDLLDAIGCPNIEACIWGSSVDAANGSLLIFAPQGVLETWKPTRGEPTQGGSPKFTAPVPTIG